MRNNRFRKAIIICLIVEAIVIFGTLGKPLIPPELAALPFYYELLYLAVVHIFGVAALLLFLLGRPRENWFQDTFPAATDQLINSSIEPEYDVSPEEVDDLIAEMEQIANNVAGPEKKKRVTFFKKISDYIGDFILSTAFIRLQAALVILGIIFLVVNLLIFDSPLHWLNIVGALFISFPLIFISFFILFSISTSIYYSVYKKSKSRFRSVLASCSFFFITLFIIFLAFSSKVYDSSPSPESPEITAETIITERNFIASSQGDKFHKPGCRYVDNISSGNEVYYETREDAIADGKTACSVCDP